MGGCCCNQEIAVPLFNRSPSCRRRPPPATPAPPRGRVLASFFGIHGGWFGTSGPRPSGIKTTAIGFRLPDRSRHIVRPPVKPTSWIIVPFRSRVQPRQAQRFFPHRVPPFRTRLSVERKLDRVRTTPNCRRPRWRGKSLTAQLTWSHHHQRPFGNQTIDAGFSNHTSCRTRAGGPPGNGPPFIYCTISAGVCRTSPTRPKA